MESEDRYLELLKLQNRLNKELQKSFESSKDKGRDYLSRLLIDKVENLIDTLNHDGYSFGRIDYGGSVDYETSEQWYCDGPEMGTGIVLHFLGYSVQVSWEES